MPKSISSDDAYISETGNWNVAEQYTKLKIMKPLYLCDVYEDIATFGYESVIDELNNHSLNNDIIRIKALKRLIRQVIRVIDNSKFAMKKLKTRETVVKYKGMLLSLEGLLASSVSIKQDRIAGTSQVKIKNMQLFETVLTKVSQIKSKINEPLNMNHLIFTDKEVFDPQKYKEQIKKDAVTRG